MPKGLKVIDKGDVKGNIALTTLSSKEFQKSVDKIRKIWKVSVSCTSPLTVGTEQGPISALMRSEASSCDIISGIADKNSPAVFNHYCPRKGPHTEIYVATKSFGKEIVVIL